jgi:hypothetical protein
MKLSFKTLKNQLKSIQHHKVENEAHLKIRINPTVYYNRIFYKIQIKGGRKSELKIKSKMIVTFKNMPNLTL